MTYKLKLRPGVQRDVWQTSDFIAQHSVEVAFRFQTAVDGTLESLIENPLLGSIKDFSTKRLGEVRTWRVDGFPNHLVVYAVREREITVYAITHGARNLKRLVRSRI